MRTAAVEDGTTKRLYIKLLSPPGPEMKLLDGVLHKGGKVYVPVQELAQSSRLLAHDDDEMETDDETIALKEGRRTVRRVTPEQLLYEIRIANEDELSTLFKQVSEDDAETHFAQLWERRSALDVIRAIPKFQSLQLVSLLLDFWTKHSLNCDDVIHALTVRASQLAQAQGPAPDPQILNQLANKIASLGLSTESSESGCERRAHLICQFVAQDSPSIAIGHMVKVWTFPRPGKPLSQHGWKWHVAPCLNLGGQRVVFDPVLLTAGHGSLAEWLGIQQIQEGDQTAYRERPWELPTAPDRPGSISPDEAKELPNRLDPGEQWSM